MTSTLVQPTSLPSLTKSGISRKLLAWTTKLKQRVRPLVRDPIPDHVRVFDAIAGQDAGSARAAMNELIELALFDTTTAPKVAGSSERDGAAA